MTELTPPPVQPQGKPPASPQAPQSPQDQVSRLRAQLAEAKAALPRQPGSSRLRVTGPHDSFTVAGVTLTRDYASVPAYAAARLKGAATAAGVTIEEA